MVTQITKAFLCYNAGELRPALRILNTLLDTFPTFRAKAFQAGFEALSTSLQNQDCASPERASAGLDVALRELAVWADEIECAPRG